MNEQERLIARFKNSLCYGCSGLLALLCIAMPLGTAYAQTEPHATGTVTCEMVTYVVGPNGEKVAVMDTVTYDVRFHFGGDGPYVPYVVENRWGSVGGSIHYSVDYIFSKPGSAFDYLTTYFSKFYGQPPTTGESQYYSETGQWQIRIAKSKAMTIAGQSFVVQNATGAPWRKFAADCTWNLKGTYPY